jgi:hypothetical protein
MSMLTKVQMTLLALATTSLVFGSGCGVERDDAAVTTPIVSALNTVLADTRYSDANGWAGVQYYSTIRFPDINGDGLTDVCGRGTGGVWCAVDDGTGAYTSDTLWSSTFSDANGWAAAPYYSTIAFPDLNGDGKADLCGRGIQGIQCALSNGSSFGAISLWNSSFSDANGWAAPQYYTTIKFADVNGDGKADVCARGIAGVWCALSTGTGFGAATLWSSSFSDAAGWTAAPYYSTISFPDVDGDGKADLCGRGKSGISCALSTGSAFGATTVWSASFSDANGWTAPQYYSTIQFGDVDGNGKVDVCARGIAGVLCGLSTGGAFTAPTVWNASFSDANGWTAPQYYSTIHLVDGVLCGRGVAGLYCSFSNLVNAFGNQFLESSNESDANGWTAPQYYRTIALTRDLKLAGRGAGGIWSTNVYTRDNLSIGTVADLDARRTALITKVWGRSTVDTVQGVDSDTTPATIDVQPLPAGVTVRRYTIDMPTSGGIPIPGGPALVQGLADHFIPPGGSTKLVVLNPGHACNYTTLPYQDAPTVIELLNEGYAVLATYMPRYTPLDCASGDHNQLFDPAQGFRPAGGANPLIYFLDPVRRSLNYAISNYGYTQITMAGLSGGGWTTTLYAALDTRITTSVPVAGSEPFYARPPSDAEQENNPATGNDFFNFTSAGTSVVTGYKDLYLLGSYGAGRRQIQVLNRNDDCCFGQNEYIGVATPWDQAVRAYENEVRQRIYALGAGSFRVEINEADDCNLTANCGSGGPFRHELSKNTRVGVILAELGGGYSSMGAADGTYPFARGMDGHLYQSNGTSGWTSTNLAVVGTPAVVRGAVNAFDVFYRDPTNHIGHATFNGSAWIPAADIGGVIISDPSAVSWGAGRIDVAAVGTDYRMYHWWWNGSWNFEKVSSSALAVGPLALTSWGPSRLDILFRGHDAGLYHMFTSTGSAPWTQESTGGVIRQFPAATTTTGSLWAYVTGTDSTLYRGQQVSGGSWSWTNVSMSSGSSGTPIAGSPGAFRSPVDGSQRAYARLTASPPSPLGLYALVPPSTTWTFVNQGAGPFLGSPVATDLGAFVLDAGHAAWLLDGAGWHPLGGYIER